MDAFSSFKFGSLSSVWNLSLAVILMEIVKCVDDGKWVAVRTTRDDMSHINKLQYLLTD